MARTRPPRAKRWIWILPFCAYASLLPEGDSKIARQFTAGSVFAIAQVPKGRPKSLELIQPSLRDGRFLFHNPTLERVGYSQFSLREMANDSSA